MWIFVCLKNMNKQIICETICCHFIMPSYSHDFFAYCSNPFEIFIHVLLSDIFNKMMWCPFPLYIFFTSVLCTCSHYLCGRVSKQHLRKNSIIMLWSLSCNKTLRHNMCNFGLSQKKPNLYLAWKNFKTDNTNTFLAFSIQEMTG